MDQDLAATSFVDSDHPNIQAFASEATQGAEGDADKASRLFTAVRDAIRYDPYAIDFEPQTYVASAVLESSGAYCIPKAVLLCAAARAVGIRAMLGFADVRNHLNTRKLADLLGTDIFVYHGYTALFINGQWRKATPSFNIELCERFGVPPLEFDGENDALLHAYDGEGRRHMEYINDHGLFADVPFDTLREAFMSHYPMLFEDGRAAPTTRFEDETPLA